MSEEERRYKVVYVSEDDMMTAMTCLTDDHAQWVRLPVFKGLPEGFCIRAVHYEYSRMAFAFIISHESFPIVPPWQAFVGIEAKIQAKTFDMNLIRRWAKEHPNG